MAGVGRTAPSCRVDSRVLAPRARGVNLHVPSRLAPDSQVTLAPCVGALPVQVCRESPPPARCSLVDAVEGKVDGGSGGSSSGLDGAGVDSASLERGCWYDGCGCGAARSNATKRSSCCCLASSQTHMDVSHTAAHLQEVRVRKSAFSIHHKPYQKRKKELDVNEKKALIDLSSVSPCLSTHAAVPWLSSSAKPLTDRPRQVSDNYLRCTSW